MLHPVTMDRRACATSSARSARRRRWRTAPRAPGVPPRAGVAWAMAVCAARPRTPTVPRAKAAPGTGTVFRDGMCGTTPGSCAAREGCKEDGQCTSKGFGCVVASAKDFEHSEACTVKGLVPSGGTSVSPRPMPRSLVARSARKKGSAGSSRAPTRPPTRARPGRAASRSATGRSQRARACLACSWAGGGTVMAVRAGSERQRLRKSTRCADDGWCTMREEEGGFGGPSGPACAHAARR